MLKKIKKVLSNNTVKSQDEEPSTPRRSGRFGLNKKKDDRKVTPTKVQSESLTSKRPSPKLNHGSRSNTVAIKAATESSTNPKQTIALASTAIDKAPVSPSPVQDTDDDATALTSLAATGDSTNEITTIEEPVVVSTDDTPQTGLDSSSSSEPVADKSDVSDKDLSLTNSSLTKDITAEKVSEDSKELPDDSSSKNDAEPSKDQNSTLIRWGTRCALALGAAGLTAAAFVVVTQSGSRASSSHQTKP